MNEYRYEHLQGILERLKLTHVPERLDQLAEEAAKESWTYVEFLDRVLDVEVSARVERDVTMKTRLARFPFVKTLEQFDFSFQPALNEAQIRELATARFVAHGENILLLGPPGVGKTHLAVSLGVAAIMQGISVVFFTLADLVDLVQHEGKEDRLEGRLHALCKPKLLILDEMGYVPLAVCRRERFSPKFHPLYGRFRSKCEQVAPLLRSKWLSSW